MLEQFQAYRQILPRQGHSKRNGPAVQNNGGPGVHRRTFPGLSDPLHNHCETGCFTRAVMFEKNWLFSNFKIWMDSSSLITTLAFGRHSRKARVFHIKCSIISIKTGFIEAWIFVWVRCSWYTMWVSLVSGWVITNLLSLVGHQALEGWNFREITQESHFGGVGTHRTGPQWENDWKQPSEDCCWILWWVPNDAFRIIQIISCQLSSA